MFLKLNGNGVCVVFVLCLRGVFMVLLDYQIWDKIQGVTSDQLGPSCFLVFERDFKGF